MKRGILFLGAIFLLACGESTSDADTNARDCRNDGIGCTEGFVCMVGEDTFYACLPETEEPGGEPEPTNPDGGTPGQDSETPVAPDAGAPAEGSHR